MSSGVTFTCLFFASVEEGSTFVKIGMTSSAITATCKPIASTWLQPKFSSFDHISFTRIGFTAKGRGASFGGEKNSLMRVPKPPKFAPQATASLLFTGLLEAGLDLKNSARLLPTPIPKDVCEKGASRRSRTLIGRSTKNCLTFDQKLSGMRISGLANFGTAEAGTETAGAGPADEILAFVVSGGRRLIKLPGTVYLFNLDADNLRSVYLANKIRAGRERLRAPSG